MFWFFHVCAIRSFICYLQSVFALQTEIISFEFSKQRSLHLFHNSWGVSLKTSWIINLFGKHLNIFFLRWSFSRLTLSKKNCDDLNLYVVFLRIFADREQRWILIFPLGHFGDFTEWAALSASVITLPAPLISVRHSDCWTSTLKRLKIRFFPGKEMEILMWKKNVRNSAQRQPRLTLPTKGQRPVYYFLFGPSSPVSDPKWRRILRRFSKIHQSQ